MGGRGKARGRVASRRLWKFPGGLLRAGKLSVATPVAGALSPPFTAATAKATKEDGQILFEHGLEGGSDIGPQAILDRIIPACVGR